MKLSDSCVPRLPLAAEMKAIWKGPEWCGQTEKEANAVNPSQMMELGPGQL